MRRLKLLGLGLVAVFALGAFMSTAALGAAKVLTKAGVESENFKLSGNSVKETKLTVLKSGLAVKCPEVTTEGEQTGKTLLGTFHLHWKGCTTSLGGTCTGLGDESGLILALGTFHIVFDSLTTLGLGVLFLVEPLHFTCVVGLSELLLVKGEVLCLATPTNSLTKTITVKCETGPENGDPKETVYWNHETGAEVKMGLEGLLTSKNGGAFEMSAQAGEGVANLNEELEFMA